MQTIVKTYYQVCVETPLEIPDGRKIKYISSRYGHMSVTLDNDEEIHIDESHFPGEGESFKSYDLVKVTLAENSSEIIHEG